MGELAGIIKVDNRVIGDCKVGAIAETLSELYAKCAAIGVVELD